MLAFKGRNLFNNKVKENLSYLSPAPKQRINVALNILKIFQEGIWRELYFKPSQSTLS